MTASPVTTDDWIPSPAGFVSRATALTIDAVIIGVSVTLAAFTIAMISSLVSLRIDPRVDEPVGAALVGIGGTLFAIAYHGACWSFTGRTPGKALMGLQVVGRDGKRLSLGRALLRFVCYWLSAFPLGMGFLWVIFDRDRRAWHDMIVHSRVVYVPQRASDVSLLISRPGPGLPEKGHLQRTARAQHRTSTAP